MCKVRAAYRFLMKQKSVLRDRGSDSLNLNEECSAYRKFVDAHETFLDKHDAPAERKRRRPYNFLEQVGVETALWPHLHWKVSMCESYARASDVRRKARTGRRAFGPPG